MDEIVFYLSERRIQASLHAVFENERMESSSMFGISTFGTLLESGDPPHWMICGDTISTNVTSPLSHSIRSLESYEIPDELAMVYPFTFSVSVVGERVYENQTDRSGWQYSSSFQGTSWQPYPSRSCCVRRRKWERLMVLKHQYHHCICVLPEYYKQLAEFRCLHPLTIKASLGRKKISFSFQQVVQHQRKRHGVFSGRHLQPDDPPEWAVGPSPQLHDDPTQCDVSNLGDFNKVVVAFDRRRGFDLLHDFIYVMHPDKDMFGWEYNGIFSQERETKLKWHSGVVLANDRGEHSGEEEDGMLVRRRIWFRTVVADCDLADSKACLTKHLCEYPSSTRRSTSSSDGALLLLNSFGTKWRPVVASLSGNMLLVHNSESKNKLIREIDLRDHIMSVLGPQDCPGRKRGFGLRLTQNKDAHYSFEAVFSAENDEDHVFWTEKIEFQMCQVDFSARRLLSGPPHVDKVLLVSDMWVRRKSKMPHQWALKTLELHESGFLMVYRGVHLKYQHDVIKCKYLVKSELSARRGSAEAIEFCGDGSRFEFDMLFRNRECMSVRAMTQSALDKWLRALADFDAEKNCEVLARGGGVGGVGSGTTSAQVFPEVELVSLMGVYGGKC